MTANSQTCMLASAGIHATAALLFLFAPAFLPPPRLEPEGPVLTIESDRIRLTDGNTAGGGNPEARMPAPSPPKTSVPPTVPNPKQPEPQVKTPEPPPRTPPLLKQKPPLATDRQKAEPPSVPKKAQDVDPTLPGKTSSKKPIEVAKKATKRTADEAAADETARKALEKAEKDKEAKEMAAAAAAAAERREKWERSVRDRADAIRGAAGTLGSTLSGKFSFDVPGKGGEAYAPYTSYLAAFYKLRWKKPTTLSSDRGEVGAEIRISKDGRVMSFKITSPSGIRALDDSVRDVLDRNRQLRPFPEGAEDAERTITIRFDLSAASAL